MKGQPFKRLAGALKHVAPTLLAATGGPLGALAAGVAKRVLGDASMSDSSLEEALATATGTAEGLAKIREIEAQLKQHESELGVRFEQLEVEDRQGARQLAMSTTLLPQMVLAALYTVAYIAVLWALIRGYAQIPTQHEGLVQTLLGALGAVQLQVMNFFFGSSSGSARKTDVLARNGH